MRQNRSFAIMALTMGIGQEAANADWRSRRPAEREGLRRLISRIQIRERIHILAPSIAEPTA